MAQLPSRTSVMVRSSKALQVLDGFARLQSCRGGLTSCRSKYAWRPLVSMCICRSAQSDSQQSGRGLCKTSNEKAVRKERPHGFSLG